MAAVNESNMNLAAGGDKASAPAAQANAAPAAEAQDSRKNFNYPLVRVGLQHPAMYMVVSATLPHRGFN